MPSTFRNRNWILTKFVSLLLHDCRNYFIVPREQYKSENDVSTELSTLEVDGGLLDRVWDASQVGGGVRLIGVYRQRLRLKLHGLKTGSSLSYQLRTLESSCRYGTHQTACVMVSWDRTIHMHRGTHSIQLRPFCATAGFEHRRQQRNHLRVWRPLSEASGATPHL